MANLTVGIATIVENEMNHRSTSPTTGDAKPVRDSDSRQGEHYLFQCPQCNKSIRVERGSKILQKLHEDDQHIAWCKYCNTKLWIEISDNGDLSVRPTENHPAKKSVPDPPPGVPFRLAARANGQQEHKGHPPTHTTEDAAKRLTELSDEIRQFGEKANQLKEDFQFAQSTYESCLKAKNEKRKSQVEKTTQELNSLFKNFQAVRDHLHTELTEIQRLLVDSKEVSQTITQHVKEATTEAQQLGQRPVTATSAVSEEILSRKGLQQFFNAYHAWLEEGCSLSGREQIADRLPDLFDLVEKEALGWMHPTAGERFTSETTRDEVCEVLNDLQSRIHAWQCRVGMVRYGNKEEHYNPDLHLLVSTLPTDNEYQHGTIAEVLSSGYRFIESDYIIRRAGVVKYVWNVPDASNR